ncbi:phosphatidate cytidylyltransferase [Amylibacter sp. IMCC11727]|uniref:phosphatidate cytidylyltransferase n=1 Tax=Amylibacter sp. IMCC11727 TaxID=3039851 RepID=UPI00244DB81D|nr:phosphatidate cytidylyltransferase [Amylibacter sp. IMCC11727]WGI20691.1 phosphatidate cytidylyltransferase [Amylibacter sp. IMCC11727]
MSGAPDFSDLMPRIVSAVALIVIGLGCMWVGGDAFGVLLIVAAGLMAWEVSRMHATPLLVHYVFGLVIAAVVLSALFLSMFWAGVLVIIAAGAALIGHHTKAPVVITAVAIVITCTTLFLLRSEFGFGWTVWLVLVVVASDVGGYFAGKVIGGPKVLPKISPKKTWSGTLGGWALAAVVGFVAVQMGQGGMGLILVSVLMAIAAQIGDLLESLMKRRADVKDSSNLIPGHGGLLDRFDGTMGAAVALSIVMALGGTGLLGLV